MVFIYILKLENNKYYIGKTTNPNFRLKQHFNSSGSQWTKKYKPIKILELKSNCDNYDEDKYTKMYMDKYGINNVRGGSYVQLKLDNITIQHLEKMNRGTNDKCFLCGKKNHFVKNCNDYDSCNDNNNNDNDNCNDNYSCNDNNNNDNDNCNDNDNYYYNDNYNDNNNCNYNCNDNYNYNANYNYNDNDIWNCECCDKWNCEYCEYCDKEFIDENKFKIKFRDICNKYINELNILNINNIYTKCRIKGQL